MKKKVSFREKARYWFDRLMGKGTITLVAVLFLITALVVVIFGMLGSLCNGALSAGNSIWQSLMHALDAGTLAGDDVGNVLFVVLMSVVTLCGIFVTSILIGIISSGFEEKLNSLRKGFSKVVEEGHTVIVGFDDSIYTILSELIEANKNQKRGCIVIIGQRDKEEMEEEIHAHIKDMKTTEIICRSGNATNMRILEQASVETAHSVILNCSQDLLTIKALLSIVAYLKDNKCESQDIHIVSLIHEKENLDAARIAGEGKAEVVYLTDILARIIAHTCRQPGMSLVLTDLFDYGGAEFYYEEFPETNGHAFGEILNWFKDSTVVGYLRGEIVFLNPPMEECLQPGDQIIHLAEDDGVSKPNPKVPKLNIEQVISQKQVQEEPFQLLVFGCNPTISIILSELDEYVASGSHVTLVYEQNMEEICYEKEFSLTHIILEQKDMSITKNNILEELITEQTQNVLILNDMKLDEEMADARTILLLLRLRDIAARKGYQFNIVSEMNSAENQKLSKVAKVNDFVVGSMIANLILTQISENRKLLPLFEDLLDADGSEIYMKPVSSYVACGTSVDFYTLTEIAKQRREIPMGYRKMENGSMSIVMNPSKDTKVVFEEDDKLIVIAED